MVALVALAGPIGKIFASMALSLLSEKMIKRLTYRSLKAVVGRYQQKAYASPGFEDDKTAEYLGGVLKDLKEAWSIEE